MVDLHNHILPGVDDGARDLNEAMEMARQAIGQGTTVIAATPHRYYRGHEQQGPFIEDAVQRLQRSLDRHLIPLRLVPGVEIPMRPDTVEALNKGVMIPLGGASGRYPLIEPPFDRIPAQALPLLKSVIDMGLVPVIAHPERNAEVQRSLAFLETCTALGMIIQLTAGSIIGKFGAGPQRCARAIAAQRGWKVIIASDSHEPRDRTPGDMRLAMEIVAEWLGDEKAAQYMVDDLPRSLIA